MLEVCALDWAAIHWPCPFTDTPFRVFRPPWFPFLFFRETTPELSVRPLRPEAEVLANASGGCPITVFASVMPSWRRRPKQGYCCGCPPRRQLERSGGHFGGTDGVIDDARDVGIDDVDVESRWHGHDCDALSDGSR